MLYNKRINLGFTLVELLLGISISLAILFAFVSFQRDIFSLNENVFNNLSAQDEVRRALKQMVSDIRVASPSSLGSYPIVQAASSTFVFYSNVDNDAFKERVRYFVQDGTIMRGVTEPSGSPLTYDLDDEQVTELVHGIANATTSIFSFYDESYNGSSPSLSEPVNLTAVRLVKVELVVDKDSTDSASPLYFTTQIQMRNIKDDL